MSAETIDMNHPFVVHNFVRKSTTTPQNSEVKRVLLDLGILLLEIFHKESLEAYAKKPKLTLDSSYEQQSEAARQWLEISEEVLLPPVWDAVLRCIECAFDRDATWTSPDWNDAQFRDSFCDWVVKPLWNMCHSQNP